MGKKTTAISIAVLVIIIIAGLFFYSLQSTITDAETQLKQEYNTYWGNQYDENVIFNPATGEITHRGILWNCGTASGGFYQIDENGESLTVGGAGRSGGSASCDSTRNFIGQEVVAIFSKYTSGRMPLGVGCEGSYLSGDCVLLFKPYTLNPNLYDVYANGKKVLVSKDLSDSFIFTFSASGYSASQLRYIGYKTQYSCDLSSDEVWIQENFAESFSIKDLKFIPTKLCKETRPFVLRDIQQGETAWYPDPIPAFNRGGELLISQGKIGVVNYATYFVDGVNNKCAPNEANIKVADRWVCSQVIKPIEVVVQCQQDADCYVPIKPQCFGYFTGCKNNVCTYDENIPDSPQCKNEVITIIKQTELVKEQVVIETEAENTFSFTQSKDINSFYFGDALFTADVPSFSCGSEVIGMDTINPPNPRDECWQTIAKFGGTSIIVKNKETKDINEFIRFAYVASGTYILNPEIRDSDETSNYKNNNWGNSFYFSVRNGLKISLEEENKFILQNAEKKIKIKVKNNLPRNIKAFILLKQTIKATNENLPEKKISVVLNSGENIIEVPLDTAGLGLSNIEIRAFYPIESTSSGLIRSDGIITNYQVVTEIPSKTEFIIIEKEVIKYIDQPIKEKSSLKTILIVAGIAVAVILVIFLIIWLMRRK